jgi:Kdo2-lipid IVA lauroyltransferase/acyltransferase
MTQPTEKVNILKPAKYWPIYLAKAILYLLSKLPYRIMLIFGNSLGWLVSLFPSKNGRKIMRNLELCFPDLPLDKRKRLMRQCWQSHTTAALETAMGWWGNKNKLRRLLKIEGEEYLQAALSSDKGLMLITGHFTCLELQGVMLSLLTPYSSTAKHLRDPIADYEINKARRQHLKTTLFPENLKEVHKRLFAGETITFLLDQDYGKKGSVFAPFFGIETATTTALSRIAKTTKSNILPMLFFRRNDKKGYILQFLPPLDNYPSDDAVADASKFNQVLENAVKQYPEQYGWTYERFATRPEGMPKLYD